MLVSGPKDRSQEARNPVDGPQRASGETTDDVHGELRRLRAEVVALKRELATRPTQDDPSRTGDRASLKDKQLATQSAQIAQLQQALAEAQRCQEDMRKIVSSAIEARDSMARKAKAAQDRLVNHRDPTEPSLNDAGDVHKRLAEAEATAARYLSELQTVREELLALHSSSTATTMTSSFCNVDQIPDMDVSHGDGADRLTAHERHLSTSGDPSELQRRCTELEEANAKLEEQLRSSFSERPSGESSPTSREVEEVRLQLAKLQQAYDTKSAELSTLRSVVVGHHGGGADLIIESLSRDMVLQLGMYLRSECLRGGTSTREHLMRSFHVSAEVARELTHKLSTVMLLVKLQATLPAIASIVHIRETLLRHIVAQFVEIEKSRAPGPRREMLLASPASAKYTFGGCDRLAVLRAATARNSTLWRLHTNTYLVALICSYLSPVVRGNRAFAVHTLTSGESPIGSTRMIFLDPATTSFNLLEAHVTAAQAAVVIVTGVYAMTQSLRTGYVNVTLGCQYKQECIVTDDGSWKWSGKQRIERSDPTRELRYCLRWDSRHNGLCVESAGSTIAWELTVDEIASLTDLYSGTIPLSKMLHHPSWTNLQAGKRPSK